MKVETVILSTNKKTTDTNYAHPNFEGPFPVGNLTCAQLPDNRGLKFKISNIDLLRGDVIQVVDEELCPIRPRSRQILLYLKEFFEIDPGSIVIQIRPDQKIKISTQTTDCDIVATFPWN